MHILPITSACLTLAVFASAQAATFPSTFEPMRMNADEGLTFSGGGDDYAFGWQTVVLGDINGDGLSDIAVWVGSYTGDGKIIIVPGSPDYSSQALTPDAIASAGASNIPGHNLIMALGDFNGDGLDDWLLVSDDYNEGPPSGAAIVLGRQAPYPTPLDIDSLEIGTVMQILFNGAPVNGYQSKLSPVGDINGDGLADLAVFSQLDGTGDQSTISIILGTPGAVEASIDIATVPEAWQSTTRFAHDFDGTDYLWSAYYGGQNLIVDANADGINDLLFGDSGLKYLVFGSQSGLPDLIDFQTLDGSTGSTLLAYGPEIPMDSAIRFTQSTLYGQSGNHPIDDNGDGVDDLVFNSHEYETYRFLVSVVYGRNASWPAELNVQNLSPSIGNMKTDLDLVPQNAGDMNGDGNDDWLMNRFDEARIIYGQAEGGFKNASPDGRDGFTLAATTEIDYFNEVSSLQGDFNGDGIDDLLIGTPNGFPAGVDIDPLIDDPYSDENYSLATGSVHIVFGRLEAGAPASPWNAYPALSRESIELRWQLPLMEDIAGFEILNAGRIIATPGPEERSFDDSDAPRFERQTYELVTLDSSGARSAPLVLSVNNDAQEFPELGGDVYSDTLAEIFWGFQNREYDIYRDGVKVDRLWAQSWLDTDYDPSGHVYRIETVTQYYNDRVLRSLPIALPAQTGTRPPGPVTNLHSALYSAHTLELFWDRAEWGTDPLSYEVRRNGEFVATTTGNSLMDYDIERYGGYDYEIITIDDNGRRSSPATLYVSIYEALAVIMPTMPDNLTSTPLSETSLQLQWGISSTGTLATGFDIYREDVLIGRTSERSFTVNRLEPDTQYYAFSVVAFNEDGQRSEANYFGNTYTLGGPLAPQSASALAYGPHTVEVFWSRVENNATTVTRYDIYRDDELLETVSAISFMDYELQANTDYQYTVYSVSETGVRSSDAVTTTVRTPTN